MRRVFTLFVLLTTLSVVAEHDYIPYLAEGKEWVEFGVGVGVGYTMYTIQDTVEIDEQQYCRMSVSYLHESATEYRYLYEEGKKVYMRRSGADVLLYDFGLQVGDSIETGADYYNVLRMDSIETITLNGLERNKYFVSIRDKENSYYDFTETWIEGIGCISFPLLSLNRGASGGCTWKYYYEPETGFIYPEDKEPIDFDAAVTTIDTDAGGITRNGNLLTCDGEMAAYDTTGRRVAQGATIDLATLPRGIYIVRTTLRNGATESMKVVW